MTRGQPGPRAPAPILSLDPRASLPQRDGCLMVPGEMLLGVRGVYGDLPVSVTSQPSEESALCGPGTT